MNDEPIDDAAAVKKEKMMRTVRLIWMIIMPVFAFVILLRLYSWSQGKGGLHEILSPLGMICVGLANIYSTRNKTLSSIFVALGLVLVVAGLITLFIY